MADGSHTLSSGSGGGQGGRPGRRRLLIVLAVVFAVGGIAACYASWKHYRKVYAAARTPIPVLDFIPVVPKENQEAVMSTVSNAMKLTAFLPGEQQEKVREIWKTPPRSLTELIEKQRQMDSVLTPEQLNRARPVRRFVQGRIVDQMFERGRDRIAPEEFDKLKDEVKRRVEERMSGK